MVVVETVVLLLLLLVMLVEVMVVLVVMLVVVKVVMVVVVEVVMVVVTQRSASFLVQCRGVSNRAIVFANQFISVTIQLLGLMRELFFSFL